MHCLQIEDVEVPEEVKQLLRQAGFNELYPPQEDALRKGLLNGKNLVLASPTASGKTLIAELCALKYILEKNGKILYLTPLRALTSEKYDDFRKYSKIKKPNGENIKVTMTTGDFDSSDPYLSRHDVIIATNEKIDSLIRHRAHWINDISLVVADEIHLLQDGDRGPTLEVAITRLKHLNPNIHLLALSATISNAGEIAEWLDAEVVSTKWRPVPLREGVALQDQIFFQDGGSSTIERLHPNPAINVSVNTIKNDGQSLIFAETRKAAVNLAHKAAVAVREYTSKTEKRSLSLIAEQILSIGERTSLGETLARLVNDGVAFHHAGISSSHRKIVENNFRRGLIKLIAATPTLAAGVNLPARTVVVSSYVRYEPGLGRLEIPIAEYKQMAGRAGRPKYDASGDAVLIAKTFDEQEWLMDSYVSAGPERIWSKLAAEKVLRSHTLATIASGFARSEAGLYEFFEKTFYAHQYGVKIIRNPVRQVLDYLVKHEMVRDKGKTLEATEFGKRVSELYIDPESAVVIRDSLNTRALVLTDLSFLHLVCHTPDVSPRLYPGRGEHHELQLFLNEHKDEIMSDLPEGGDNLVDFETLLGELKSAKVLHHWIEEAKENEILEHFKVEPGDLYRLVDTADWLLYASYELAELFKHRDLLSRLNQLRKRAKRGVKAELVPLIELEGVGRIRARVLFDAGYKDLEALKHASIQQLRALPLVGAQTARQIKDQVGGLIKKEELQMLKTERTEQSTLSEFEPNH